MAREQHARLEGERIGIQNERIEMAKRLLKRNIPIEDIVGVTGFTIEYIKNL